MFKPAVKFSKRNPQLIAIGLYDGSVEILDITDETGRLVGRSERLTSSVIEPIWDLLWIKGIKLILVGSFHFILKKCLI
jgi:dynein intermediate chain 4, axonemal